MLLAKHASFEWKETSCNARLGDNGRLNPFLVAALVSLILTAVVAQAFGIVFETVDDYNIMMSLSGEKTGSPYWELTFYNAVFSFLQSLLYDFIPGVQWYSIIELSLIYGANLVFLGLILERCRENGVSWILAMLIYFLIFCAALLYPLQRMQFTTTAALLGMSSCAAIYSIDDWMIEKGTLWRRTALSGVLMLLCLLERQSAGLCALIFWISGFVRIALLVHMGKLIEIKNKIHILITVAIATLVLCALFTAGHELINRFGDNAHYTAYDEWRVQYQDYPRPSYDDAADIYTEAGWTQEIYSIATSLTYIAPEINEQSFMKIVDSPEMDAARPSPIDALFNDIKLVITNKAARSLFCALLAIYVLICGQFGRLRSIRDFRGKSGTVLFVGATGTVLLAIIASFAICLSGRWPLRSFQAIALPLMACLTMIALELIPQCNFENEFNGNAGRAGSIIAAWFNSKSAILFSSMVIIFSMGALFGIESMREARGRDAASIAQMASIEQYAIEHPDDVFVHDYSVSNTWNSYDPFRVYKEDLSNLIISGGSYTYSGCYLAQLESNGMSRLTGEELLDENIYYISDTDHPSFLQKTLNYMRSTFGDVAVEEVASLYGGATVYKFKLN